MRPVSTPRALLLDIGGVVLASAHERMAVLGAQRPELAPFTEVRGVLGPRRDEAWEDVLAERATERGYWAGRAAEYAGIVGDRSERGVPALMAVLYPHDHAGLFRPEVLALMDAAHDAGLVVAALTNDLAAFHGGTDLADHPVLGRFDTIVDGSETGVLKPDPAGLPAGSRRPRVRAGRGRVPRRHPRQLRGPRAAGLVTVQVDLRDPGRRSRRPARCWRCGRRRERAGRRRSSSARPGRWVRHRRPPDPGGPRRRGRRPETAGPSPGVLGCAADIGDDSALDAIRAAVDDVGAPVRMVVQAAGLPAAGPLPTIDPDALGAAVALKVGGMLRLVRAVAHRLGPRSRLVALGGHYGSEPSPHTCAAGVTNAALANLVRQLADHHGPDGVTAHLVAPGPADTDRLRRLSQARADERGVDVEEILAERRAESPLSAPWSRPRRCVGGRDAARRRGRRPDRLHPRARRRRPARPLLAVQAGLLDEPVEQALGIGVEPARDEPLRDPADVAHEHLGAVRVPDEVDDLRQVDQDQPVVGNQDVVGRQIPVGPPEAGEPDERRGELVPQFPELGRARTLLGEPGCGGAVGGAEELQEQLGPGQLDGIGHRDPGLGTAMPSAANSAAAHCPASSSRPNAVRFAIARVSRERRTRRPSR